MDTRQLLDCNGYSQRLRTGRKIWRRQKRETSKTGTQSGGAGYLAATIVVQMTAPSAKRIKMSVHGPMMQFPLP